MTPNTPMQATLHFVPGFIYGLQQPSLHLEIKTVSATLNISHATHVLQQVLPFNSHHHAPTQLKTPAELAHYVSFWCEQLMHSCNIAPIENAVMIASEAPSSSVHLYLPLSATISPILTQWMQRICDLLDPNHSVDAALLTTLKTQLSHYASQSSNTPHFLRAAQSLRIQVEQIAQSVYQFGQGNQSYLLESTFTEHTSNIASKLARSKLDAARLMRQIGLPIPAHHPIHSLEEALELAETLHYPVVVKPISMDGGHGVFANLQNAAQLKTAYAAAHNISPQLMLEKHIEGRDYRLTVFRGRLIWAIERVPASVVGDGKHRIDQLVDAVNQDTRRGNDHHQSLKKIQLDEESIELLASHGMTIKSIPEAGRFVALKRKSNVSAGGMPVAVTERVHPDNARLAVQAAIALRLDFAGIDLIMPDIEQSYLDVGGGICEINAQPQLGSITTRHLYPEVLQEMVPKGGRIAVDVFVTDNLQHPMVEAIRTDPQVREIGTGFFDGDQVFISGQRLNANKVSAFQAAKQLILCKNVLRIVMIIKPDDWLLTGSPLLTFDSLNLLVLQTPASMTHAKQLLALIANTYQTLRVDEALHHAFQPSA